MVTFLDQFVRNLRAILLHFNWINNFFFSRIDQIPPKTYNSITSKMILMFLLPEKPHFRDFFLKILSFYSLFRVSEGKNENFRIQAIGDNPKPNRHIIYEPKIPMQRPLYHKTYNDMLLSTPFSAKSFYT